MVAWAHESKPVLSERMSSGVPGPQQQACLYVIETGKERWELGTKPEQPNRNQLTAPGPRGQHHLICNKDSTEDLVPRHPAWPLLPETHVETLAQRTKLSSPLRRKNGGLGSWHQDCLPFKAWKIGIWDNGTDLALS